MFQNRRHKTRRNSIHRKERGIERFLSSRLFIVLGVSFLITGIFYSIGSSSGSGGFFDFLINALQPSNTGAEPAIEFSGKGFWVLLLYFMPVIVALSISNFYAKRFARYTYPAALIITLYLIAIQVKVLGLYLTGETPSFFIAMALSLILPVVLLFFSAFLHRKPGILILTCFYVYISMIIYTYIYGRPYDYLFPYILLFSGGIYWIGHKIKYPTINLINFFFATGFSGLFWARNFILNSKTDTLLQFYIIGILFYLLFYTKTVLASHSKTHPLRSWMQMLLSWSNLAFFVGTTSFVLVKYYSLSYLWVFVLAVLLFNILGLYLQRKYKSNAWALPHYFAVMLLAALVLPLLLMQNVVLLFSAVFSVLMLQYAIAFKNKAAMWLSLSGMAAMLAFYIFTWAFRYLPALMPGPAPADTTLLWHGVISGIVLLASLWLTRWLVNADTVVPLSKKWFSRTTYHRFIRAFLLAALFLTFGWTGAALANLLTGSMLYSTVAWFIAGSLFFMGMIYYYSGKQSALKKPVLYLAFGFALLYPLLVHWSMYMFRKDLILTGTFAASPLLLHYLALALLLALGIMTVRRIYLHLVKYPMLQGTVQAATVFMLLFVVCTEYDTLSVLANSVATGYDAMLGKGDIILPANKYLPYSILMWGLTLAVLLMATLLRLRFLRNFSLILFLPILAKIFIFDFPGLSQGGRSGVFIGLGVFLIGFALVYPRLARGKEKEEKGKIVKSEVNQQSESHPSP